MAHKRKAKTVLGDARRLVRELIAESTGPWADKHRQSLEEQAGKLFGQLEVLVNQVADPAVRHAAWMENKNYRHGFESFGTLGRDQCPYVEGWWADNWQAGWDYAKHLHECALMEAGQPSPEPVP